MQQRLSDRRPDPPDPGEQDYEPVFVGHVNGPLSLVSLDVSVSAQVMPRHG